MITLQNNKNIPYNNRRRMGESPYSFLHFIMSSDLAATAFFIHFLNFIYYAKSQ